MGKVSTLHTVHCARQTIERRLEGYFARRRVVDGRACCDEIIDPGSFDEEDLDQIMTNLGSSLRQIRSADFDSIVC